MPPKEKDGCVRPVQGPIPVGGQGAESDTPESAKEVNTMMARVGQEAPDFEASAYVAGQGFAPVKLSDYRGEWIVLCFYPGDFTFV